MKTFLSNLIRRGSQELAESQIPNPAREAHLLLQFVIKSPAPIITLDPSLKITPSQAHKFQKLIARRKTHEPFAYLTGQADFYNLPIIVNKHVLIPRPETEILVDLVIKQLKKIDNINKLKICDIGTGSGAISIALAKSIPEIRITATDKYKSALKIATKNISKLNLEHQIKLVQGDLLNPFQDNSLDMIIANLPYIPSKIMSEIDKTVKDFEPHHALFSGRNGLDLIKKLLKQARSKTKNKAIIFLEIWPDQVEKIKEITQQFLPDSKIEFIPDLCNIPRFCIISLQ